MNKITEITRTDIKEILIYNFRKDYMSYHGKSDEINFLKRIYNLKDLPSIDSRYSDAEGDIFQHTINNDDWEIDWIFYDDRFELMSSDEKLLKFICEVFHPAIRDENKPWEKYLNQINDLLKEDGYELYEYEKMSGRSLYKWKVLNAIIKNEKAMPLKLKQIGEGSYSKVYSYVDDFYEKKFVLKRAKENISKKDLARFNREFEIMKSLNSPYIVEVYKKFVENKEYTMEFMDTTLHEFICSHNNRNTLNFLERFGIVNQILRGFLYLETKEILHRDISYKNILLKKYDHLLVVKISDFGLVKLKESTLTDLNTEFRGSLNDPKLERVGLKEYSILHEIYSLTKIITFILTGKTNFSKIKDQHINSFLDKGTNDDLTKRYKNIFELQNAVKKLKSNII